MSDFIHKKKKAAVVFILITAFLDIVALGIIVPVFPQIIKDFSSSLANTSLLNSFFLAIWAVMQFFSSPIIGSLSDRFGRRRVILISTAGLSFDYIIIALAPNLWWLLVGRILGGLTSSTIGTVYAYMSDITDKEHRAKAFGFIGAAFSAGLVIGPVIGGFMGEISLRAPFWLAAALSAIAFLYGLFILPESLKVENRMPFSWARANPIGALKLLTSQRKLFMLAIIGFIANACNYVFPTVMILYAHARFQFTTFELGGTLAIIALLDIIVQVGLVGTAVKYLTNEGAMTISLFVGGIGIILLGIAPTPLLFFLSLLPLSLWGIATPTSQMLMTSCLSESEQGQLQGANMSINAIAGIIAPLVFGGVYALFIGQWKNLNLPGAPFILTGLFLFVASYLGRQIMKKSKIAK